MKNDVKDINKPLNKEDTLNINKTEQEKQDILEQKKKAETKRRRKRYWMWVRNK